MPNGYTGGFEIMRKDFLEVLQGVPGDSVVGMGLTMAAGAITEPTRFRRLGDLSASEMIRRLEDCEHELIGVEEQCHVEYMAFVHLKESTSQHTEVLALVIRPSSPIHDSFRTKLNRSD